MMKGAYTAVVDFLRGRKKAYQLTFQTTQSANVEVLLDLARFCRASESAAVPGDRDKTMILVGRREVWLRIQNHLNLNEEQLVALYAGNGAELMEKGQ